MLPNKLIFMAFLSIRRSIFGADSIFLPDGREIPDLPRIEGAAEITSARDPNARAARAVGDRRTAPDKSGSSLAIGREPRIDRHDRLIDDGVAHAALCGDWLDQAVARRDIGGGG